MTEKYVYPFGTGTPAAEDISDDRLAEVLGGKGRGLATLSRLGLPVPPGFTISTAVCAHYYRHNRTFPIELESEVRGALALLEKTSERAFGDTSGLPLLVSVRSGARASMPGMMDTILNVGINDRTVFALGTQTGDWSFAYDCYRRLIEMYGTTVHGADKAMFDQVIGFARRRKAVTSDEQLDANDWQAIVSGYKAAYLEATGHEFPQDPYEQLWGAINAVFASWQNERAKTYRRLHNIPDDWGTAVTVQQMVFGNAGDDSGTGVVFTRNPSTGEHKLYGEFLPNAQGEDIVAGTRTPLPIARMQELMPEVYDQLGDDVLESLEIFFADMQDVEFTVERGTLYILQTRSGKRSALAAVKIAVEMAEYAMLTRDEALMRVDPSSLDQLLHPVIASSNDARVWVKGLAASPGAVSGVVVFTAAEAVAQKAAGKRVILVREETSPEDIEGMHAAAGILTARGGLTSHAAVVARGMGKPCVAGASDLSVNASEKWVSANGYIIHENDRMITIDGHTGRVYIGEVPTVEPKLPDEFHTLMQWADDKRRLRVRANAETPTDARKARELGAEGIGLVRTEHMFFGAERIPHMVAMIMSETRDERRAALGKLLPMQRDDFKQLFTIMAGLPVTVRLLDPPLHEFLPKTDEEFERVAHAVGKPVSALRARARELHEVNPMLGLRGVRLGILYPEIIEMQARAIFEAAYETRYSTGVKDALLEIMIPLVIKPQEFEIMAGIIRRVAGTVMTQESYFGYPTLSYNLGTMIETPAAAFAPPCLVEAGAEFFSLGTNDLTQTMLGISRDDAGTFIGSYIEQGIFSHDPFASIDKQTMESLIRMIVHMVEVAAQHLGRSPMKIGVCGEHGGDPRSIEVFHENGISYVSCSPYRVPVARLAAAQVAVRYRQLEKGRRAEVVFE